MLLGIHTNVNLNIFIFPKAEFLRNVQIDIICLKEVPFTLCYWNKLLNSHRNPTFYLNDEYENDDDGAFCI